MFELLEMIFGYRPLNKCRHENALLDSNEGYCPDCGAYLKKNYYVVRCSHCDIKRDANIINGEIIPQDNFCENCGGQSFYVEKFEEIRITDIRHAICVKEEVEIDNNLVNLTQVWVGNDKKLKRLVKNP